MIDNQFLSGCTEKQINKGMAWLKVKNKNISMLFNPDSTFYYHWCNTMLNDPNEFCINHSITMPIAFDNDISIKPMNDNMWPNHWGAGENRALGARAYSENPLRAICEVYILMESAK